MNTVFIEKYISQPHGFFACISCMNRMIANIRCGHILKVMPPFFTSGFKANPAAPGLWTGSCKEFARYFRSRMPHRISTPCGLFSCNSEAKLLQNGPELLFLLHDQIVELLPHEKIGFDHAFFKIRLEHRCLNRRE